MPVGRGQSPAEPEASSPARSARARGTPLALACGLAALLALAARPLAACGAGAQAPDTVASPAHDTVAVSAPGDSLPARAAPFELVSAGQPLARGTARGQVMEPSGLAVDAFGRLLVADAALHRVQRLEPGGRWLGESGTLGSAPGEMRSPVALASLGSAGWALLDRENRRITAYDLFGRLLGVLVDLEDPALADRVGRVDPVALATDRGGAAYVADADRDRLLMFDFAGAFVRVLGGFGDGPGSFRGLAGVAVAPRGELVTAERIGARVQRLDAGGQPRSAWPLPVSAGPGMLPVAVDDSARVAVADERGGRLWVFDPFGRLLAAREGLAGPRALVFEPDGSLLVAESRAGRVSRFRLAPVPDRPARRD